MWRKHLAYWLQFLGLDIIGVVKLGGNKLISKNELK